jgi:hypothetical protein
MHIWLPSCTPFSLPRSLIIQVRYAHPLYPLIQGEDFGQVPQSDNPVPTIFHVARTLARHPRSLTSTRVNLVLLLIPHLYTLPPLSVSQEEQ